MHLTMSGLSSRPTAERERTHGDEANVVVEQGWKTLLSLNPPSVDRFICSEASLCNKELPMTI